MNNRLLHIKLTFAMMFMVMGLGVLAAPPAQAQQGALQIGGLVAQCEQFKAEGVLVPYVVRCTETIVRNALATFITQFYPVVIGAVTAALTLGVTLFGVMVMMGALEKASRDTFVVLFKFGAILFFIQPDQVLWLFNAGMTFMEDLTNLVFQWGNMPTSLPMCMVIYGPDMTLWQKVECMLDTVIGINRAGQGAGTTGDMEGVARGLFHFFTSGMATRDSGGLAPLMGGLGFYVAYTIMMATIKSIHTYLAAIIGLGFMLLLAPIFVPCIFFKVTRTYFDKWMRICGSFILQPVILFGFLSFMMIVMDQNLFAFKSAIAGEECANRDNCFVSDHLRQNGGIGRTCVGTIKTLVSANQTGATGVVGGGNNSVTAPVKRHVGANGQTPNAGSPLNVRQCLNLHKLNLEQVRQAQGARGSMQDYLSNASISTLTMALTAFIFISMLNYIPNMATDLSGGIYEVPNLYKQLGEKLPGLSDGQVKPGTKMGGIEGLYNRMLNSRNQAMEQSRRAAQQRRGGPRT